MKKILSTALLCWSFFQAVSAQTIDSLRAEVIGFPSTATVEIQGRFYGLNFANTFFCIRYGIQGQPLGNFSPAFLGSTTNDTFVVKIHDLQPGANYVFQPFAMCLGIGGPAKLFTVPQVVNPCEPPTALFAVSSSDLKANFASVQVPGAIYLYNFGDGQTSSDPNPTHAYSTPGAKTVTLIVLDTCGADTMKQVISVTAPQGVDTCAIFGPVSVSPFTVTTSGDYSVIVTNPYGCQETISADVTVNCPSNPPSLPCGEITASYGNDSCAHATVCKGPNVSLYPPTGLSGGLWYPGGYANYSLLVSTGQRVIGETYVFQYKLGSDVYFFDMLVKDCPVALSNEPGGVTENIQVTLAPNPARDQVQVNVSEEGNYKYAVVNSAGKTLRQTNTSTLEVADLPAGIYYIQIFSNEGEILSIKKFVKN